MSSAENDPAIDVAANLKAVRSKVTAATQAAGRDVEPTLVAVSKFKPAEMVKLAYDCGQRHFGENYVQELCEKHDQLPDDVLWHFIGHLQSNKSKTVVGLKNLHVVETVSSVKLANTLNKACETLDRESLNVFVQVNTGREESKSGIMPENAVETCQHVVKQCTRLTLCGLMAIGRPGVTEDLDTLVQVRAQVAAALGVSPDTLALSMGMSGDMEAAVARGSTNIRVGTAIFGARPPFEGNKK